MKLKTILPALLCIAALTACTSASGTKAIDENTNDSPLRVGVAGVTHGHLGEVRRRIGRGDFEVVGVSEEIDEYRLDNDLTGLVPEDLFFKSLGDMLDRTKPEVVVAYGSAHDHLAVVRECAPRHIDVMVEKPLCTSVKEAEEIEKLARKYGIRVLVNYETTWYASNEYVKKSVDGGMLGKVFKIEVYDGHSGPFEIGCAKRFTDWLTDPELNGAGALFDFGCYGADLATWLFGGKEPRSVSCVLKNNKPEVYTRVDDDATILVEYDDAVVEINASWCWPFNRKDMRVYGLDGSIYQKDPDMVMLQDNDGSSEFKAPALESPYNDSFLWLKALERGEIELETADRQGLENNITVVKILDAARKSARTGKPVRIR